MINILKAIDVEILICITAYSESSKELKATIDGIRANLKHFNSMYHKIKW